MEKLFLLCMLFYFISSLTLFIAINKKETVVIMDEKFHIPQNQKYCNGNFQWDPKITTLPGLYLVTTGIIKFLEIVSFRNIPCSIFNLRLFNLFCNAGNLILFYLIICKKFPGLPEAKKLLSMLNLSLFPLLYFFTFLFYTEPLSIFLVLAMHYLWMTEKFFASSVIGGLSVLTRQTNIVWVFFHGVMTLHDTVSKTIIFEDAMDKIMWILWICPSRMCPNQSQKDIKIESEMGRNFSVKYLQIIPTSYNRRSTKEDKIFILLQLLKQFTKKCTGYLLVGLAFATFVFFNDGIVVGDREAHKVSFNSTKLLYFSLFTGFFCLPIIVNGRGKKVFMFIRTHPLIALLTSVIVFLSVHYNTKFHYYNIVDSQNQHHIVNILFNQVNDSYVIRYILIPFYVYFGFFIIYCLLEHNSEFFTITFSCVVLLNLIPQLLLEFRYFIPAFLLFRLNIDVKDWKDLIYEIILFSVVNATVLWIFLCEPVSFDSNDPDSQIIIW